MTSTAPSCFLVPHVAQEKLTTLAATPPHPTPPGIHASNMLPSTWMSASAPLPAPAHPLVSILLTAPHQASHSSSLRQQDPVLPGPPLIKKSSHQARHPVASLLFSAASHLP